MNPLSSIESLGGIDADNDQLLIKCFQNHDAYKQVVGLKKFIILGRKGTGKTAIFKKILKDRDYKTFSFGHTFSDYPWHYHDKQVKLGVPDFDKYTHSWKYLIYLTISKILLNQDNSIPFDETSLEYLGKIEKFIVDTYGTRDPDLTQVFTPSKFLKIKPNLTIDMGFLKGQFSAEKFPMEHLPSIIQEVNTNLSEYVISSLNPDHGYYILFDQLDLGFDPTNQDYNNRLIGLLLAARDINNSAKDKNRKLGIIVFLRDDIYNKLKFEDKNKLTVGYSTIIEWDARGTLTLKDLIESRLTEVLSTNETKVQWNDIFDEAQQMTGRQSKYNYIIDRTFLRPRDMIQFCNEIINQHNKSPESRKVDNAEIYSAKNEYSQYFLNELDDEIHKHLPEYEGVLEVIKKIGYYQFDLETFKRALSEKSSIFLIVQDAVETMKSLFEFSIIGYYKAGGSGFGGSEYIFRYRDLKARFDENAKTFRVHPGLIETLGLKRSTSQAPEDDID